MKILLVYPEFTDTFWSFKHALPFVQKKATTPPLGLLTVAALLPSGWEKRLIDMNVTALKQRDLEWADYVFVSAMVAQRDSTIRVIERCHAAGVKIVAGGPLFLNEHASFPLVDHFVLNEGEVTLPLFLHDLATGQPQRMYTSELHADMHLSPTPLWSLADLGSYSSMPIQYSRGCPFDCDFCNITAMLGRKPRTKSAAQIINELDGLYALGWRQGVFFVDDNFIGKRRELKEEILPALIAWRKGKRGFGFQTEASIDLADDPELMAQMVEAGFDTVFVGIETPDEDSLSECNKRQNAGRDLVECVKSMQRAGLQVQGGFIVGFDSDKPSIFQRQIDFIQRSGIVTAMVGLLQAPFGTKLYKRLASEGRVDETWTGDNVDGTSNVHSIMDPALLKEGYQHILRSIYNPRAYYERVRTFLREYRPGTAVRPVPMWSYLTAWLRSIVVLGVRGKERAEYWRLWFWTLLHRPRLFPQAITFAIYGYHFRRVCELHVLGATG